jgi:hypothetical protein
MACAVAAALVLTGCSAGDVELNGAIFDYLGVSSKSANQAEPKVPNRTGLVLPPNAERLPQPGSGAQAVAAAEAWPVDADQRKLDGAAAAQKRHEEVCAELLWKAKAAGDTRSVIRGPLGVCNPSILSAVSSNTALDLSKQGSDPAAKFTGKPPR